jgi:4-hydroxy-3-methylbut-2-en-1-yl diphosphate synthase IspG/GcpE
LPSARFGASFSTVTLHLHVEAMGAGTELILHSVATVAISGLLGAGIGDIERIGVGNVKTIPVATSCLRDQPHRRWSNDCSVQGQRADRL